MRTQLPYALFVGVIATLFGVVPVAYGMPWWLGIIICTLAMAAGLRLLGKRADAEEGEPEATVNIDAVKTSS
ncbi:hypothetical protein MBH78_03590 [Oceanimonas sp. NS1]|nr:hypothetical protein [Oceanimonas sp. NS1]